MVDFNNAPLQGARPVLSGDAMESARAVAIESEIARRGVTLRRAGGELVGPCPACGGRDRFAVNVARQCWNCRGCARGGDVLDLVKHLDRCTFAEAVATLAGNGPRDLAQVAVDRDKRRRDQAASEARRARRALQLWEQGAPINDTPAETYLRSRRCFGLPGDQLDTAVRWHPRAPFGEREDGTALYQPCLLSLLRNVLTDEPVAVQRTALTLDGRKIERRTLGPKAGAAIKLWPAGASLTIGEGLETVLSAALNLRHRNQALMPAWACIDTNNLAALPLVPGVQCLTVLTDHDAAGLKAAADVAARWRAAGRKVIR